MMILTFNQNNVRNEFLGSKLSRKVLSHMTLKVMIKNFQAILGVSDLIIARLNCINDK